MQRKMGMAFLMGMLVQVPKLYDAYLITLRKTVSISIDMEELKGLIIVPETQWLSIPSSPPLPLEEEQESP